MAPKTQRIIRSLLSYAPRLGIIKKPKDKKLGISAYVRVKDEEDWIQCSLLSIKDFVDEIIVGDNGSQDNTAKIIRDLIKKGLNIKLFECTDMNMRELSDFVLKQTSYNWVIRWDGDMIARTTGEYSIAKLREKILRMDRNTYYIIFISHICLAGDLFHQDPNELIHREEYVHTNSEKLRFVHPKKFEAIKSPKYWKILIWDGYYSFHLNIKPACRMLSRKYWIDWMELKDYEAFPTLDQYIKFRIKQENRFTNIQEASKNYVLEYCKQLIPYDKKKFGELPDILKKEVDNRKYRIIYKNERIVGRSDVI